MKTGFLTMVSVLFLCLQVMGQETSKVQFRDAAFSIAVPYLDDNVGLQLSLSTSISFNKNILKAYASGGGEFSSSFGEGSDLDSFEEYDLLYGREIPLSEALQLELYGGVGYFIADKNLEMDKVIGFPVQAALVFPTERKINFGIQAHTNINNFMPVASLGFLVKYNF
tara:strand:- start:17429 stop:17932 length:504 start_codon:yes stop_codon:yes gene_type:complete